MTPRRGTRRGEALRRAHEAKARRDAERADRESQIETALADYYQATAESERIKDTARCKADALLAAAEEAAAEPDAQARAAVRRLRDLLGGTTEVAHLCDLTVPAVRALLAELGAGASTSHGVHVKQGSRELGSVIPVNLRRRV